jgi:hypothetical protein
MKYRYLKKYYLNNWEELNKAIQETNGLTLNRITQNGNSTYRCNRNINGSRCDACFLFVPDMLDLPVGRLMRENKLSLIFNLNN